MTVSLELADGSRFEKTYPLMPPALQPTGLITVLAGETVLVEAKEGAKGPTDLKVVDVVARPKRTLRFRLEQTKRDGKTVMVLRTKNPFSRAIRLNLAKMLLSDEQPVGTSSCPVRAGGQTLEVWPDPLFQVFVEEIRFLKPGESDACEGETTTNAEGPRDELLRAIAPFVADGRASYPRARKRFLAGLPKKHRFLIFTRLTDAEGKAAFVFVQVEQISKGMIAGTIASPTPLKGYAKGDRIDVVERDVLDWVLAKPDGSEEGNLVARFLNYWRSGEFYGAVFLVKVTDTGEVQARFKHMLDRRSAPTRADFTPPSVFLEAATKHFQRKAWPKAKPGEAFATYILFWPLEPTNVTKEPPKKI